jgi:hypothetical protein
MTVLNRRSIAALSMFRQSVTVRYQNDGGRYREYLKPGIKIEHIIEKIELIIERRNTMNNSKKIISYFVLLMLIASFVACASTSKKESTGEYIDDSVITTKVKSLLAADDFLKSFRISVETYKGIVQMSGFVGSQEAVDKAGEIAHSVKGVKSVKNDLIIK